MFNGSLLINDNHQVYRYVVQNAAGIHQYVWANYVLSNDSVDTLNNTLNNTLNKEYSNDQSNIERLGLKNYRMFAQDVSYRLDSYTPRSEYK